MDAGVDLLPTEAIRPTGTDQPFRWELSTNRLKLYGGRSQRGGAGHAAAHAAVGVVRASKPLKLSLILTGRR
ncbi:hypothetical protein GCM10009779_03150 [Polymorphospora rubra]|uniref:Uncharacterized protein n=1 Tax=Polymorphospora rubra TaxID=338584 RepID=A0A810MX43_9ACTN|nr:hypothetical protein Prubr_26630 [Polymorphospora rubra]